MHAEISPQYDIYLAGPLSSTGKLEDNLATFQSWARRLRDKGYVVFSPPEGEEPGWEWHHYMKRDLPHLLRSRIIGLLPGWEQSTGATTEKTLADTLGIEVCNVEQLLSEAPYRMLDKLSEEQTAPHPQDETVLSEANRLVTRDRGNQYGPPEQDFERTAGMATALFRDLLRDGAAFKPEHVALFMVLLKASRAIWSGKRDNWVDMAGYAACGHRCETGGW